MRTAYPAFLLFFIVAGAAHAQATGKPMTFRGPIAAAKSAEDKKTGLLGWLDFKDASANGLRVFVNQKTKLEKMVGKERRPATFDDLDKAVNVVVIYVMHDGQPSMGPTMAEGREILILTGAK